jgi:NADPH:quinone reductase-like Zn-dependent oxidoreductase
MKAAVIDGYGGASALRIADLAPPVPGPGEIGIAVHAAGLNPADWKLAEGWLAPLFTPPFPYVLGFDAAGIVFALGDGVTDHRIGDRVVAKTAVGRGGAGGCAGHATVAAHLACRLPDTLGFAEAAALPTAGITAWEALFEAGRLDKWQSVLVNGGAGGTGSFAIQLARKASARIAATASPGNHPYLLALGADCAIDYRDDVPAAVQSRFCGQVDLLLDTVGQGALDRPLDMIRDGGTLVVIGTLAANEPRPSAHEALRRDIRVVTAMSSREREGPQLRALVAALDAGHIRPPEIETMPLADAARALTRVKEGHVCGKLVLLIEEADRA